MRSFIPVLVVLTSVTVAGAVPPPKAHPAESAPDSTFEYELSGLRVIHRIRNGSDIVAVRLYLLGGARQLTRETAGIELLLLRAANLEWGQSMAATGSRTLLEATSDWTVTGFVGLRRDVDAAWSALARQLQRPDYSEESFRRARGELLTAARRRFSQPDLCVRAMTDMLALQGHPYELDPHGTEESLTWLTQANLNTYWEQQFVTSRMQLVVVGAVTRAHIDSLVTATFGLFPVGHYEWTMPPSIPHRDSRWMIVHRNLPTNYILGLFGGPPTTHDDYLPFRAAVALLSSRLDMMLRDIRSLSYSAYAPFFDAAVPIGGVYASTSNPVETFEIIRRELGTIQGLRYPRSRWRRFLEQFTLDQLLQQMTSDGQADALARASLHFNDLRMADEFVERLRNVDLPSVRRVARKYLVDLQYGYLGDTTQMRGAW